MSFLPIIGAAASAFGTLESGMFQSQVARNNATIATQNAGYAREAGQEQAAIASRKGAAQIGAIKTGFAASGVDVNSGSAADVEVGARETEKLDAETVLNNAELQAYGYTTQATDFEAQSKQDEAGAIWGSLGTLTGNAQSLGFKWSVPT